MIRSLQPVADFLKVGGHPRRIAILRQIEAGHTSAQEVLAVLTAADSTMSLSLTAHHLRKLEDGGMVRRTTREKVRGVHKQHYEVTEPGYHLLRLVERLCEDQRVS